MVKLGVNIDHVATLRQARYADMTDSPNAEPDILEAASACERAGASGVTVHLRIDRRHIQDRDVFRLRESVITKLNLEMGNTPEIVETALRVLPDDVCLVPENRQEITTEGGLNVTKHSKSLKQTVQRLHSAGIRVSMFIEPDATQIEASGELEPTRWNCTLAFLPTCPLRSSRTKSIDWRLQLCSPRKRVFW
jgi:pyridoxine 5-phosphate synthase